LYDGTRRVGAGRLEGIDRGAVERVHELIALPRSGRPARRRRSGRERVAAVGQSARQDE
jgi:hypothetical protein